MVRTKSNKTVNYSVHEEPIVISKATLDIFLKQKKPGDLIALYIFYYYTAKWQQTNKPKATDGYCMKGLNWGDKRLIYAKRKLESLGLIKQIKEINELGQFNGSFIKINFIWKNPQSPQKPVTAFKPQML